MIHLEDVSKVYRTPAGPVQAVKGITLTIPPGQFVAVRGPSGCGKSTLLNLIGGLAAATSGRVVVAGEDVGSMSPAARAGFRARRIGYVFQTFHLLPYLRVEDNVALAATAGNAGSARLRARELLARFHLDRRLGHHPAELSTGESQRVAIARALLNRPPLLLADEPTGNLDAQSANVVLELIGAYHREGGTVVLVTHQDWVSKWAQRVVLLHDGQIVENGSNRSPISLGERGRG